MTKLKDKKQKDNLTRLTILELINIISFKFSQDIRSDAVTKYINSIEEYIKRKGRSDKIKITKTKINVYIEKYRIRSIVGYNLEINDCEVIFDHNDECDLDVEFNLGYSGPKILNNRPPFSFVKTPINITIKNCRFISNQPIGRSNLHIKINSGISIYLISNEFEKIYTLIKFQDHDTQRIIIDDNTFMDSVLNIHGSDTEAEISSNSHEVEIQDIQKYQSGWQTPDILLNNNKLNIVTLKGYSKIEFSGKNSMNVLETKTPYPKITWNPYQEVNSNSIARLDSHKNLFLRLKSEAQKITDSFQVELLRAEVAKCAHTRLKIEKLNISFQDRFSLGWSKICSNYGTSWLKPIVGIFILNIITSLVLISHADTHGCFCFNFEELIQVTFELFTPFPSAGSKVAQIMNGDIYSAITNVFHKVFYVALIYETVKSFRRFSGK